MRLFVGVAVAALSIAGCGYDPHPKDGKFPCAAGCPSGYECRCDKCWRKGSDGGACSGVVQDALGWDGRAAVPKVTLDGAAVVDGAAVGKNDAPMAIADGKSDAPPDVADGGTAADVPLPISTTCVADQSRFDECSLGP